MSLANITDHRRYGDAVLNRLNDSPPPAALRALLREFAAEHRRYVAAADAADSARAARDKALAKVAECDASLDGNLGLLGNALVGANLGNRKNPFASFTKLPPAKVADLAYLVEVDTVRKLIKSVKDVRPPADVSRRATTCERDATAVQSALAAYTPVQTRYARALADRDKLLPSWTRALNRLKKNANAVWADEPETYRAMFAPPDAVTAPVKHRKKSGSSAGAKKKNAGAGAASTA